MPGDCLRNWSASILSLFRPVDSLFRNKRGPSDEKHRQAVQFSRNTRIPRIFETHARDGRHQVDAIRLVPQLDYLSGRCEICERDVQFTKAELHESGHHSLGVVRSRANQKIDVPGVSSCAKKRGIHARRPRERQRSGIQLRSSSSTRQTLSSRGSAASFRALSRISKNISTRWPGVSRERKRVSASSASSKLSKTRTTFSIPLSYRPEDLA